MGEFLKNERCIEHKVFDDIAECAASPHDFTESKAQYIRNSLTKCFNNSHATICGRNIIIIKTVEDDHEIYDAAGDIPEDQFDWYGDNFYPRLHHVKLYELIKYNNTIFYRGIFRDQDTDVSNEFLAPVNEVELTFYKDAKNDFDAEITGSISQIPHAKTRQYANNLRNYLESIGDENEEYFDLNLKQLTQMIQKLRPKDMGDAQAYLEKLCFEMIFSGEEIGLDSYQIDVRQNGRWKPYRFDSHFLSIYGKPRAVFFEAVNIKENRAIYIPYLYVHQNDKDDNDNVVRAPIQMILDMEVIL